MLESRAKRHNQPPRWVIENNDDGGQVMRLGAGQYLFINVDALPTEAHRQAADERLPMAYQEFINKNGRS